MAAYGYDIGLCEIRTYKQSYVTVLFNILGISQSQLEFLGKQRLSDAILVDLSMNSYIIVIVVVMALCVDFEWRGNTLHNSIATITSIISIPVVCMGFSASINKA